MMKTNKLKIFISGANGFIGNHLKNYLSKNYYLLTPNKKKLDLNNKIKLKEFLKKKKPDIIIHLASSTKFKSNSNLEKNNQISNTFNTTKNLVDNLNIECELIIFFGSIEEYGKTKTPFKEIQKVKPISYYGKYKYSSFKYIKNKIKKKKLNIYGYDLR